ncbi:MAG: RloB family protein [Oscillospiraceae bacterium]|nr:RloB family protein [Oscillospiraceae bacterium]
MSPQKRNNRKKIRKIEHLPLIEHRYYIFCEGEQTEPLYFHGLKEAIEENPIYKNTIIIQVEGVGAETLKVLEAAEDKVRELKIENAQVWCVYDKDSFPSDRFNRVSERVANLNHHQSSVEYRVAWSNQCIEYWFMLHFDYYDSDNDRKYYRAFLHKQFKKLGWQKYEKNNAELFKILTFQGNPKQAINWAKERINLCIGYTDSLSVPATKVHELVEELANYLPDEIRVRYINE